MVLSTITNKMTAETNHQTTNRALEERVALAEASDNKGNNALEAEYSALKTTLQQLEAKLNEEKEKARQLEEQKGSSEKERNDIREQLAQLQSQLEAKASSQVDQSNEGIVYRFL